MILTPPWAVPLQITMVHDGSWRYYDEPMEWRRSSSWGVWNFCVPACCTSSLERTWPSSTCSLQMDVHHISTLNAFHPCVHLRSLQMVKRPGTPRISVFWTSPLTVDPVDLKPAVLFRPSLWGCQNRFCGWHCRGALFSGRTGRKTEFWSHKRYKLVGKLVDICRAVCGPVQFRGLEGRNGRSFEFEFCNIRW